MASRLRELLLQVAEEQGKADYFGPVEWPFSIEVRGLIYFFLFP